jgi:photosystem II stability/assembly factor-like uncharacterized protein
VAPYSCSAEDIRAGGLSCTEDEPCAIFLEISAVDSNGHRILAAGNIHSESVTLSSVLLTSDDDGKTWTEAYPPIRSAGLDRIQFLDSQNGWISGGELSPLPRNPFFLITSDGGNSWRQRPLFNEEADNRFGAVQQVSFSRTGASAVVDRGQGSEVRYVLFESNDAGDTWQIRQESSKPIALPHPFAPSATWRERPDAATKSSIIERRVPGGWQPVASFAVRLAPCVPPQ